MQLTLKHYLQSSSAISLVMQIAAPILLVVFAVIFQVNSLNDGKDQQLARTALTAQDIGATLASSIAGAFQTVDLTLLAAGDYIRDRKSLDGFDESKFSATVDVLQHRVPSLLMVRATDERGSTFHSATYQENVNVADRDYFKQLRDNPGTGMVISEPLLGRFSHRWVIICARRFNLTNGQFGGIIYASIDLDGFVERVTGRQLLLSGNDAFVIRDEQHNILVRYALGKQDMSVIGQKVSSPNLDEFDKSGATSTHYIAKSTIDHVERVFFVQRIKDLPMSLAVGLSTADALEIWRNEARKKWITTAVFILVVVMSFFLLHHEQLRKLEAIRELEAARDTLSELGRFNEAIFLNSPLPKRRVRIQRRLHQSQ